MIDVKGLYKDFGSLHVLRGVSLHVDEGEIVKYPKSVNVEELI